MDLLLLSGGGDHNPSRCCGVLAPCDIPSEGRVVIGAWTLLTSAINQHVQSKRWSSVRLSARCRHEGRFGVHIVAFIEHEKPKEKGSLTRNPFCRQRPRPSPLSPECIGIGQLACCAPCG